MVSGLDEEAKTVFEDEAACVRYIVVGQEKCPDTDRLHDQGFVQFTTPCSLKVAQKRLGLGNAHMEICRGSCEENDAYCKKDGDFWFRGEYKSMGQRVDVDEVRMLLEDSTPMLEVARANFPLFCRSYRAFQTFETLVAEEQRREWRKVTTIVLAGTSGCGKTRLGMRYSPFKIQGGTEKDLQWWDGYGGQKTLLIDEFDSSSVPITRMLSLLDGHPLRLAVKGGFTYAAWTRVIITTNEFSSLYASAPVELKKAFDRRVTIVYRHFEDLDPAFPEEIDWAQFESE